MAYWPLTFTFVNPTSGKFGQSRPVFRLGVFLNLCFAGFHEFTHHYQQSGSHCGQAVKS